MSTQNFLHEGLDSAKEHASDIAAAEADIQKFDRMKAFRDATDNDGDGKFLALSEEAGFSIEDWVWFTEREKRYSQKVGCETSEGLLKVHSAAETCEVCANVEGEVPKPKRKRRVKKDEGPQPFWNATRIKEICSSAGWCKNCGEPVTRHSKTGRDFFCVSTGKPLQEVETILETGKSVPNSYIVYRLLQALYKYQTADEQAAGVTNKLNNVGFSGADSVFLSSVAQSSQKYGRLTLKQAVSVGRCLKKYAATQLAPLAQEAASTMPEKPPVAGYRSETEDQARQVQTQSRPVQQPPVQAFGALADQLAAKKADDPEGYYDPFCEGEKLSEEAATQFWTKRFASQPYVRK